jgi:hypothetical protein
VAADGDQEAVPYHGDRGGLQVADFGGGKAGCKHRQKGSVAQAHRLARVETGGIDPGEGRSRSLGADGHQKGVEGAVAPWGCACFFDFRLITVYH